MSAPADETYSPEGPEPGQRQYKIVKKAIEYLRTHLRHQPSLSEISKEVHLSEYHLQRVFSDWAGISPKKFLQYLTKEYALSALSTSKSVEQSALDLGLSGPNRLHDLLIKCVSMTPSEVRAQGKGVDIEYGSGDTPFGQALVAWTEKGVCHLVFNDASEDALSELKRSWPKAQFGANPGGASVLLERIFLPTSKPGELRDSGTQNPIPSIQVLLRGTEFQMKVWEALLKTPPSTLTTYSDIAAQINAPQAQRAVGTAIGRNSIAYLIPCHRVIRATGEISNYRWGVERKMAMIGREASLRN